jgi:PIN domain nuclease of toxin-antitoxin system
MPTCILDASVLLAITFGEIDQTALDMYRADYRCIVSAINYSEAAAKLCEKGMSAPVTKTVLERLSLEIIAFDTPQALLAGSLRGSTKKYGLSFGDRACLALAMQQQALVLTADRAWKDLDVGVDIVLVR